SQNPLGWNPRPIRHRRLRNPNTARKLGDATGRTNRFLESSICHVVSLPSPVFCCRFFGRDRLEMASSEPLKARPTRNTGSIAGSYKPVIIWGARRRAHGGETVAGLPCSPIHFAVQHHLRGPARILLRERRALVPAPADLATTETSARKQQQAAALARHQVRRRLGAARRYLRAVRQSPAPAVRRPRWHRSAQNRASRWDR